MLLLKGNRKPRILIYENVRFNKVLEPSRFERIISETAKGFDLIANVATSGKYYLIYQYGPYVQIFINMMEDVRGVRNNWEVKPKFYILKTYDKYMHMAEKQVCILLDILKKHHMAQIYQEKL